MCFAPRSNTSFNSRLREEATKADIELYRVKKFQLTPP